MKRRTFLRAGMAGAAGWVLSGAGCRTQPRRSAPRPNIVFVMTDDQPFDALGASGRYPFLKTPNMDRLAREGVRFSRAFATTSLCSPSRASILTGTYSHVHGVISNNKCDYAPSLRNFGECLQQAGYETAFLGKWHQASNDDPRPGFDTWFAFGGQGEYENPTMNENGESRPRVGYVTDLLSNYAVRWIERPHARPFCLCLWHKAPHSPAIPAARHRDAFEGAEIPPPPGGLEDLSTKPAWQRRWARFGKYPDDREAAAETPAAVPPGGWNGRRPGRLDYFRLLLSVDEGLGRILDALERTGQFDDTMVVFASDNGSLMGAHHPKLYGKVFAYEESIRVPLLVRYPRLKTAPGTVLDPLVLNIDYPATFLDLAGAAAPETFQGRSLLPMLNGDTRGRRESILYEWLGGGTVPSMLAVRTDRWKYVHYLDPAVETDELYDLESDPHEFRNAVDDPAQAGTLTRMRAELERLKERTRYAPVSPAGASEDDA